MAGALAAVNPCGFPLLPAFLSFYVGAGEGQRGPAAGRLAEGVLVGLLVTAGFLAVFVAAGLPVAYGARAVAEALPWAGIGIGVALALLGVAALAGRVPALVVTSPLRVERERRAGSMVVFGAGYGIASLGCTLPVFLALVGVSLASSGAATTLAVFAAYAAGMALVLMALAIGAALLREGLARALRRLLPHMGRIGGALLLAAGAYLSYYWARIRFGETATLADDPIVAPVTRFSARIQVLAEDAGLPLLAVLAAAVALVVLLALRARRRGHGVA